MKSGFYRSALLLIIALSASVGQCAIKSPSDNLPGIRDILPQAWTCRIIDTADSQAWPTGLFKPIFIAYFLDTVNTFSDCHGWPDRPNLSLCFYPDSLRDTIAAVIKMQEIFSWCVPIKYLESAKYFIVTSPCYSNNGCFSPEAKRLIAPLDSALGRYFNSLRSTTQRVAFSKPVLRTPENRTTGTVLANGRVVGGSANSARSIGSGVRFSGTSNRVVRIK
jgi:hypothetical protein